MRTVQETDKLWCNLFVNLFQELELLFQSLASVFGVDMQQGLVVQILQGAHNKWSKNSDERPHRLRTCHPHPEAAFLPCCAVPLRTTLQPRVAAVFVAYIRSLMQFSGGGGKQYPKIVLLLRGCGPPPNTCFLGPVPVHNHTAS